MLPMDGTCSDLVTRHGQPPTPTLGRHHKRNENDDHRYSKTKVERFVSTGFWPDE